MRISIAISTAVLFLAVLGGPARAESPAYESSDPERGERVHAVDDVSVTFDEPLDFRSSDLMVSACGDDVTVSEPHFPRPDTIRVEVDGDSPGTYLVEYSVKGLTPGEARSEGSFEFSLHHARCNDGNGHKDHDKDGPGKDGRPGHRHGDRKREHGGDHDTHDSAGDGDHDAHASGSNDDHDSHTSGGDHEGGSHGDHSGAGGHGPNKRHSKKGAGHGDGPGGHRHHERPGRTGDERPTAAPERPGRPSPVLNLVLVLLFPAAIGLIGGRALRARTAATAS